MFPSKRKRLSITLSAIGGPSIKDESVDIQEDRELFRPVTVKKVIPFNRLHGVLPLWPIDSF